jgi:hypothetical protein
MDNLKLEIKVETLKVKTKDISIELANAFLHRNIKRVEDILSYKGFFLCIQY